MSPAIGELQTFEVYEVKLRGMEVNDGTCVLVACMCIWYVELEIQKI